MDIRKITVLFLSISLIWVSCKTNEPTEQNTPLWEYNPTYVSLSATAGFPPMNLPQNNLLTEQGINLGKLLFYDPILSGDSTLSCAGCHNQQLGFTDDNKQFSQGIDGLDGTRNAMPIFNMAYSSAFFWDGRASTLADQSQMPVTDPLEMHANWSDNIKKLQEHPEYPRLFYEAFEIVSEDITPEYAGKAMEQFMLTLISDDSKYDKYRRFETNGNQSIELTALELEGMQIFVSDTGGDCFHCHGDPFGGNVLMMELNPNKQFRNNGLDEATIIGDFVDPGLGGVTKNPNDYGKFKVPTLRNIELTAPYMHDGRFASLEEVIEFYSTGVKISPTVDSDMQFRHNGGVQMTQHEKEALLAFLKTLTDYDFIANPSYSNPF